MNIDPGNKEQDGSKVNRRDLLAVAAGVGLLTAASNAPAQTQMLRSQTPKKIPFDSSILPQKLKNITLDQTVRYLEFGKTDGVEKGLLSDIVEPIDVGADKLLQQYKNAKLVHPPHQIEYLVETLSEHIANCVDLRRQAQELEAQAIDTRLGLVLDEQLNKLAASQAVFNSSNMGRVLANKVDPRFVAESGEIEGTSTDDDFFKVYAQLEDGFVTSRANNIELRKNYYRESGGGANFEARSAFLKRLFGLELVEAYRRARSVSAGLKTFYDIAHALPNLTNVGYLDELAIWTREAVYRLERTLMGRDESIFTLPLMIKAPLEIGVLTEADFNTQRAAGHFTFTLKKEHFERQTVRLKKPLLRGLDIAFSGAKRSDPLFSGVSTVFVKLAKQPIVDSAGDKELDTVPEATISPVDFLRSELPFIRSAKSLHNVSPIGDWELKIDKANSAGKPLNSADNVENLVLIMRLTHEIG